MNPSTWQNAIARLGDLDPPRGLAVLSTPDRPVPDPVQNEAFVGRIFEVVIGALELVTIYVGHCLGFYDALREGRSFTAPQMYVRSLADRRQVLECLEQQAAAGILMVEDALWHGPPPAGQPPRDRWFGPGVLPVAPLGCEAALRGIPSQDEDHSRPNTRPRTAKAGYVVARAPLDHGCFLFHARSGPSETSAHAVPARHWTY